MLRPQRRPPAVLGALWALLSLCFLCPFCKRTWGAGEEVTSVRRSPYLFWRRLLLVVSVFGGSKHTCMWCVCLAVSCCCCCPFELAIESARSSARLWGLSACHSIETFGQTRYTSPPFTWWRVVTVMVAAEPRQHARQKSFVLASFDGVFRTWHFPKAAFLARGDSAPGWRFARTRRFQGNNRFGSQLLLLAMVAIS